MITSFPLPATTATSHARSSPPPELVTERPFVRPISSRSSFLLRLYFGTPRNAGTFFATMSIGFSLPSFTTRRATLRQMLPSSRSSERTPASRV